MNQNDTRPGLPRTLSHKQLTAALILVTLLPFCFVVALYFTLPKIDDPVLDVDVRIGSRAWPNDSSPDARLVPCVILRNPTEEPWENLNMSINEQFHFFHPATVRPNEEVFVPLKFFSTKGNAYFPPESQQLKLLTIYAQVSSGARAIVEIEGQQLDFLNPN